MLPKPGDRVLYMLDDEDASGVNARRENFQRGQATNSHGKHPHVRGGSGASGHIAHVGLVVHEGDIFPADVIIVSDSGTLSLRVLLPGSDVQWVVNVPEGKSPGTWELWAQTETGTP